MKTAHVLVDHHGDNGTVREGAILPDLSEARFDALEGAGLVREATAAEAKAGSQHRIERDQSKAAESPSNKKAAEPANKSA